MARREGGIISRERFAKETSGRERNWHSWPSRWLMLRASFLLASFRVIDIPSLPLGGSWWPLTIESLNHASARASYTRRRRGRRGGFWRREKNFSTLFTRFFSIREKKIGWISFFTWKFAGRGKGFRRKRNFIGWDDQSLNGNGGGKKVFSIESRRLLHRCSRHRY